MHQSYSIFAVLHATVAIAQSISFINPGPYSSSTDYQDNPIYAYGSTINIQWTPSSQTLSCLVWQEPNNNVSEVVFSDLTGLSQYNWQVATTDNFDLSRMFQFALYITGSTTPSADSQFFNITGDSSSIAASATTSITSTTSTTTTTSTAAPVSDTATNAASSATGASTSAPASATIAAAASSSSSSLPSNTSSSSQSGAGLSIGAKAGIGVGVGVAVIALLAGVFVYRKKATRPKPYEQQQMTTMAQQTMTQSPKRPDNPDSYARPYSEMDGTIEPQELDSHGPW